MNEDQFVNSKMKATDFCESFKHFLFASDSHSMELNYGAQFNSTKWIPGVRSSHTLPSSYSHLYSFLLLFTVVEDYEEEDAVAIAPGAYEEDEADQAIRVSLLSL